MTFSLSIEQDNLEARYIDIHLQIVRFRRCL